MKEQVLFGLTTEQITKLNNYFLEVKAKDAIPYLQILGSLPAINVTPVEEKVADPAQLPLPLVVDNEPGGEDTPEELITPV